MKPGDLSKTGKMKKLKLLSLIMALCSMSLISCGGDDSNDEPVPENTTTSESPESNLPDEAKAFVGDWSSDLFGSCIFFSDGYAKVDGGNGYWTYDVETKILATTLGNRYGLYQWQVTLSNENTWTGIGMWDEESYVFYKKQEASYSIWYYIRNFLSGSAWKDSNGNQLAIGSYKENGFESNDYYFYIGKFNWRRDKFENPDDVWMRIPNSYYNWGTADTTGFSVSCWFTTDKKSISTDGISASLRLIRSDKLKETKLVLKSDDEEHVLLYDVDSVYGK